MQRPVGSLPTPGLVPPGSAPVRGTFARSSLPPPPPPPESENDSTSEYHALTGGDSKSAASNAPSKTAAGDSKDAKSGTSSAGKAVGSDEEEEDGEDSEEGEDEDEGDDEDDENEDDEDDDPQRRRRKKRISSTLKNIAILGNSTRSLYESILPDDENLARSPSMFSPVHGSALLASIAEHPQQTRSQPSSFAAPPSPLIHSGPASTSVPGAGLAGGFVLPSAAISSAVSRPNRSATQHAAARVSIMPKFKKPRNRMTEARVKLAAKYVLDAEESYQVNLEPKLRMNQCEDWAASVFRSRWAVYVLRLMMLVQCSFIVLEHPTDEPNARQRHRLPGLLICEMMFCVCYGVDIGCAMLTVGLRRWIRKRWNLGYCISVVFLFSNTIVGLSVTEIGTSDYVQVVRAFRPALLIFKSTQVRRLVSTMVRILPQIATTLLFGGVLVILYAIAGIALFRGIYPHHVATQEQFTTFNRISHAALNMAVLFTTENFPTVILPGLAARPTVAAVFFVSYICFGVWLFMSMLLASVYDAYMEGHERKVVKTRVHEQMNLLMAFGILQDKPKEGGIPPASPKIDPSSRRTAGGAPPVAKPALSAIPLPGHPSAMPPGHHNDESEVHGFLSFNRFCRLMAYVRPYALREELRVIFECLDASGTGQLDSEAFLGLIDVLRYRFKKITSPTRAERARMAMCRRWYAEWSEPALGWDSVIEGRPFQWTVKLIIAANIVVLCLWDVKTTESEAEVLDGLNLMFAILFLLEALCKIRAYGIDTYLADHTFDAFIVAYSIPTELIFNSVDSLFDPNTICYIQLMRSLRVLRVVSSTETVRTTVLSLTKGAVTMIRMLGILLILFYIYACIGMVVFGSQSPLPQDPDDPPVNCSAITNGTSVATAGLTALLRDGIEQDVSDWNPEHFKSFWNAMLTLFQVSTTNNWNNVMYSLITEIKQCWFFVSFFFLVCNICVNIFCAYEDPFSHTFCKRRAEYFIVRVCPTFDFSYGWRQIEVLDYPTYEWRVMRESVWSDDVIRLTGASVKRQEAEYLRAAVLALDQRIEGRARARSRKPPVVGAPALRRPASLEKTYHATIAAAPPLTMSTAHHPAPLPARSLATDIPGAAPAPAPVVSPLPFPPETPPSPVTGNLTLPPTAGAPAVSSATANRQSVFASEPETPPPPPPASSQPTSLEPELQTPRSAVPPPPPADS